ncbi:histidine phosphatase family protein [Yoonia sp. SS1-5]|uniref:Histidine phosphatase family protein n=1 Tax=Yoonia rhodophyticola TaxID=3137370 RepID=A0ABZ3JCQ4_9RHOB
MTRLWMVRHGPTHAKTMVGWADIPADLSDQDAVRRLRAYLPAAPVVSSDLSRAVATADDLGAQSRLDHDPALREMNFGDWDMRHFADVEKENPQHIRAFWETPGDIAPPNGESWNTLCDRVGNAIDGYLTRGFDDLIVVAHFGTILSQIQRAAGMTAYEAFGHKIDNLSVSDIAFIDGQWRVGRINHVP